MLLRFFSWKHRKAMSKIAVLPHAAIETMPAPWIVEIAYDAAKHERANFFTGIGVLISERHVLTCAHIFSSAIDAETVPRGDIPTEDKDFFVRYGSEKLGQGTIRHITRIIPHPDFKPPVPGQRQPKGVCDLAVLVLSDPVDTEYISIAEDHPLKVQSSVSVLGWPKGPEGTGNLQQVNTSILPYSCGMSGGLTPREMVVANFTGQGALDNGCSGGPVLFTPNPGEKTVLVGLLSRGAAGMSTKDRYGLPGIATDLTWHHDWVREICAATMGSGEDANNNDVQVPNEHKADLN